MTTASKPQYKVIGTRPVRPDGIDKVTGRAIYGADIHLPGSLRGRVKRSPHAHANIKSIDLSKALALPGADAPVLHLIQRHAKGGTRTPTDCSTGS